MANKRQCRIPRIAKAARQAHGPYQNKQFMDVNAPFYHEGVLYPKEVSSIAQIKDEDNKHTFTMTKKIEDSEQKLVAQLKPKLNLLKL